MDIQRERDRRANTMQYFEAEGLTEGDDWRWGTLEDWGLPAVLDEGNTLGVSEPVTPKEPDALPIMIRSSGVRMLGGPRIAAAMDGGQLPAEMPFAVTLPPGQSLS